MSISTLKKLFRTNPVNNLPFIVKHCGGRSKRSIIRDLNIIGYHSSYNHAGKFYTLKGIPQFDRSGIWVYKDIYFSKYGTLKATIEALINESLAGLTQKELKTMLHVRVQNSLNSLLVDKTISREPTEKTFLYLNPLKELALLQLSRRRENSDFSGRLAPIEQYKVIEVLLDLLHFEEWQPEAVSKRLMERGVTVSGKQVEKVVDHYDIKKKTFD